MALARLTEAFVRDAPPGTYSDETLPGFMLRAGVEVKSFYVQAMVRGGKQVRRKIGVYPSIRVDAARREAADVLHAMRRGTDPRKAERERKASAVTLGEALEQYLAGRRLAPRTAEGYRYFVRKYLPDWMDRTLEDIGRDRAGVRERIGRIYQEAARRARPDTVDPGARTADSVAKILQAVYNRARRQRPELPPNPCENVDFRGTRRRDVELDPEALLAWGPATLALGPARRDLLLLMALSGLRSHDARAARAEHLSPGLLRVPNPKSGRPFDLPLSPPLHDLLRSRAALARGGWLFPANSASGHMEEVRVKAWADTPLGEMRGHYLRHLYSSLSKEVIPFLESEVLMNHRVPGAAGHYVHLRGPHLREAQETASAHILAAVGLDHRPGSWPPECLTADPDDASAASAA